MKEYVLVTCPYVGDTHYARVANGQDYCAACGATDHERVAPLMIEEV